ncbi:MAG: bifunctional metallophosphatase/5'-nucleotidase [candidate division KSB1 bacterium]|nr:bifunctional metallophosphatase/5'-nucleotidase [candidate division KSB1 bacterium]
MKRWLTVPIVAVWLAAVACLVTACDPGRTERITVLYWGDFHARNRPYREPGLDQGPGELVGGAPRLAYILDSLRLVARPAIVLHTGDEFSGSAECTITKGESQVTLLRWLRPDAFVLGNHEFDYGTSRLLAVLPKFTCPVVCANLWDKASQRLFGSPKVRPYILVKAGRVRVAIIGLILRDFRRSDLPNSVLEASDPEAMIRRWAEVLQDSADLTIVLSHMGYQEDVGLARQLGQRYVDLIVGGHSHRTMLRPEVVEGVLVTQAGERGQFVGKLTLEVDLRRKAVRSWEAELVPVRNPGRASIAVAAYLDSLEAALETTYHLNAVVAHLRGNWIREPRGESNVGDWQADAFRQASGADVAFQNTHGIRKDLAEGPVRVRDFWEMNPFSNELVTFRVTGEELLRILEHNCALVEDCLQVSGVRCECEPAAPEGRRLLRARLSNGEPIRKGRHYTVCTNDYVVRNSQRYFGIPLGSRSIRRLGLLDRDVLIRAAQKQRTILARKDGRLKVRSGAPAVRVID